jgi:hypothetical protein
MPHLEEMNAPIYMNIAINPNLRKITILPNINIEYKIDENQYQHHAADGSQYIRQ